jgi:hypothetical protein
MWVHGPWNNPKNGKIVDKRPNIEFLTKKLKQKYTPILQAPTIFSLNQNNVNTKHVVERVSIFSYFGERGIVDGLQGFVFVLSPWEIVRNS